MFQWALKIGLFNLSLFRLNVIFSGSDWCCLFLFAGMPQWGPVDCGLFPPSLVRTILRCCSIITLVTSLPLRGHITQHHVSEQRSISLCRREFLSVQFVIAGPGKVCNIAVEKVYCLWAILEKIHSRVESEDVWCHLAHVCEMVSSFSSIIHFMFKPDSTIC